MLDHKDGDEHFILPILLLSMPSHEDSDSIKGFSTEWRCTSCDLKVKERDRSVAKEQHCLLFLDVR